MLTHNVEIRKMTINDLPSVMEIENVSFVHSWTKENFVDEITSNAVSNLAVYEIEENGIKKIIGFYDYYHTFDSATLAQIAVHPDYRRNHVATEMMKDIITECYAKRIRFLTLEVRKSNVKAQSFYLKMGFKPIVIKPHYYTNGEDAIYMCLEVKLDA